MIFLINIENIETDMFFLNQSLINDFFLYHTLQPLQRATSINLPVS